MSSDAVIIDIETAPLDVIPEPPERVINKVDKRLVDPVKIEAKREANRQSWFDDAPLDYRKGKIIAVGMLLVDADEPDLWLLDGRTEDELVVFVNLCKGNTLVGFNVWGFDIPFIQGRAWLNGVNIRWPFKTTDIDRPYPPPSVIDLQRTATLGGKFALTGWGLSDYARAWNLPTEPYGSGSEVAEWYANGQWDEIRKHLESDLLMTRDLFNLIG